MIQRAAALESRILFNVPIKGLHTFYSSRVGKIHLDLGVGSGYYLAGIKPGFIWRVIFNLFFA